MIFQSLHTLSAHTPTHSCRPVNAMSSECIQCCCCCCCDNKDEKYARIEYDDPDEEEVLSHSSSFVPVEKIFKLPQQWKMFITRPHLDTTTYSWREMDELPTSEDSVVKEQPRAVTYGDTMGDQFRSAPRHRLTLGSFDTSTPAGTFTESATKKTKHLSLKLKSEELRPQPRVPQLPVLVEEGDEQSYPSLQFSLHYDIQRRTLTVHLKEASNLPAKDRSGTSDPFVVMHLHPNKEEIFESKIVYKTLNPIFNQSFQFQLDDVHRQSLVFRIYDHDRFSKNDMIGGVVLPLKDVDVYGAVYRMRVDERVEKFSYTYTPV